MAYNLYWKVMLSIIKSKFLEGDSHIKDGLSSSLKLVYGELALMKFVMFSRLTMKFSNTFTASWNHVKRFIHVIFNNIIVIYANKVFLITYKFVLLQIVTPLPCIWLIILIDH